ncbi:MAG: TonB-dependent receptor [Bacteroidetes bacterium HGW-Bacteroidetes-2]|nr:MAG: TonB-dependent receptor [Bacteroidetes bacterium HGW-Bacteroidetes-2]
MKKYFLLLFSIFTFTFTFAQNYTVSGKVIEKSSSLPLEYATVSFTKSGTTELVTGGITDLEGKFNMELPAGKYDIKIEFISYKSVILKNQTITKNTQIPAVSLDFDSESLDEIIIRAETTEVQVRLDKKIYNIGKDLTTRGATVGDALSNVPSVTVDVEGGISLRGNENVRILINGRPSAIAGFGDTNALTQLPAEAIDRVEVITSPSSRYDAEGTAGILNIILKKEKTLGINGSVAFNLGYPINNSVTANVNVRTNKFNLFNTTGISYRDAPGNAFFDNTFENSQFSRTIENRDYNRLRKDFNTNLGIEYFLTENSSLTASGFYRTSVNEDDTQTVTRKFIQSNENEISLREQAEAEDGDRYQVALNYSNNFNQEGHKLTADFQYETRNEIQKTLITERNTFPNLQNFPSEEILNIQDRNDYLIQADYVLPIGKNAQFEAGYRGNFKNEITDYSLFTENLETGAFVLDSLLTNIFDYTENINAIYSQYGNKFGKFSFLLGLRLENTQLKGKIDSEFNDVDLSDIFGINIDSNFDKNYLGLFPTVNLIYELSESENVTLGYNRRINRPRGRFINPFPSRSSVTNVFQGNPDLDPAFANAFDLGYLKRWKKLTLTSSIYYQNETDAFERVQIKTGETINGIEVVRTIPINLATNERIGAEAGIIYNPAKWLRMNGSFNFFQFKTTGEFEGIDYGTTNNSWFTRYSAKVTLPSKIDWQTNIFYMGPSENSQTKSKGMLSIDLAISKDIINDNASIGVNVSDLLNTRKRKSFTNGNGFTSESEFQWRQRQITVSLTYRFNQKKNERQRNGRRNGGQDFEGDFEG